MVLLPGLIVLFALKMANEWEKAIVLRAGKFRGLRGPGLFWIVPVDVDAVLSWVVWDAQTAALEVEDYRAAIGWAAQTALRDTPELRAGASVIGKMVLADTLRVVGRDTIEQQLQRMIDERTTPWG